MRHSEDEISHRMKEKNENALADRISWFFFTVSIKNPLEFNIKRQMLYLSNVTLNKSCSLKFKIWSLIASICMQPVL